MTTAQIKKRFTAFHKKWDGKKCGTGQCVALARKWIAQLEDSSDGFDSIPSVVSAKDLWTAAPKAKWFRIKPANDNMPPVGALVIFKPTSGNVHGHVGIARGTLGPTDDTFDSFDSNWGVPLHARDEVHRFAGIYGWLYPKD